MKRWDGVFISRAGIGHIRVTRLLTDEGYVTFSETGAPIYHYYLRDHLGNIRVVMGQTGTVEQVNHYYAFGGLMRESTNPGHQPYKYGGKEIDRYAGLDAYDFGARSYFADRMQWSTIDPLCEKYYDVSPYGYCHNNPIRFIDPDGKDILIYFKDNDGKNYIYRFDGTNKEAPNNQYVQDFLSAYYYNKNNGGGEMLQKAALDRDVDIYVMEYKENKYEYDRKPVVLWNSRLGNKIDGGFQSPATGLEHEMDHAYDDAKKPDEHNERVKKTDSQFNNAEERRVITGSEMYMVIQKCTTW